MGEKIEFKGWISEVHESGDIGLNELIIAANEMLTNDQIITIYKALDVHKLYHVTLEPVESVCPHCGREY